MWKCKVSSKIKCRTTTSLLQLFCEQKSAPGASNRAETGEVCLVVAPSRRLWVAAYELYTI